MTALKTATFYVSKLVRRNWLFYFFILGILGYTIGVLIPPDTNRVLGSNIAFASSIPLRGIYFLNLFQSLIITFIVCDTRRKQKKSGYPGSAFHATCRQRALLFMGIFRCSSSVPCSRCHFHDCLRVYQYIRAGFTG